MTAACAPALVPAWTSGGDPIGYQPVLEDLAAAHQIVIPCVQGRLIAVTCNCLSRGTGPRSGRGRPRELILDPRNVIPASIAIAAWRAWHARKGITV